MSHSINPGEQGYLDLLATVLERGTDKSDRTGVGTRSIFGAQLRFDLTEGFPLLTTKKMFTKGIFGELIWLISGDTNIDYLVDNGIHIWDEWADEDGNLGPVYGEQWRGWRRYPHAGAFDYETETYPMQIEEIDQLQDAVDTLIKNPDSRRIIVNAWNPADIPDMELPPCHMMFQFEVHDGKLSCHMYMRSADMFLGVPFNIASYAGLTHVIAQITGLNVGDLIISFGDCHIYKNHFDQVREQLARTPKTFPKLKVNTSVRSINDPIEIADFLITGYDPHAPISAPVAV